MTNKSSQNQAGRIAQFRLVRHHLLDESPTDLVTICRHICGVQAQVMSAAYLQLWTRNHAVTRSEIESLLWQSRVLVKTSLMRQTLHIVPSDEFHLYIAALKPARIAGALRIMSKFGIDREESEALTALIMEAIAEGPLSRAAIHMAVRPKASKRVHAYMERVWSIMRLPVAEGLICYGSGENNEVTFIRRDRWLRKLKFKSITTTEAQCALFLKYLSAYGPAAPSDFSHWAGVPMQDAKRLPALLESELAEIPGEKKSCFLLRKDVLALEEIESSKDSVRLLPHFDPFLLAHREKDHLLSAANYKRVYRNQGWISPVVLVDGAVAGVWSYKVQNKKLFVRIEPFGKLSRSVHTRVAKEAANLAAWFERELEYQIS
jgi:hypothetical protein